MKRIILYILSGVLAVSSCEKIEKQPETDSGKEDAAAYAKTTQEKTGSKKVLKVGIIGDSISTFKDIIPSGHQSYYPRGDVDSWTKTWWALLINEYWDAELDVNCSYSGGCVAPTPEKEPVTNFLYRSDMFNNPDVILVHGGTNDSNPRRNVSPGGFDFLSSLEDIDTESNFRESYIALIRKLQKMYPKAQLIILIGTHVTGDYGESVEMIAQFFDLPYVDFRGDPITMEGGGGCHPDAAGMAFMAEKIYESTKNLMGFE